MQTALDGFLRYGIHQTSVKRALDPFSDRVFLAENTQPFPLTLS